MFLWRCYSLLVVWALPFLLVPVVITSSAAQGLQTSPYSAANEVRRGLSPGGLDQSRPIPLGLPSHSLLGPRESDTIPISSGLLGSFLPSIPNLEFGFLWTLGNNVRAGRFSADYLLPLRLGGDTLVFGEAHAEFQDFWKTPPGGANNRVDLSFGGGYRRIIANSTLVGLNGFYDTSRLFGSWYSSGGFGLEMAALTSGDGAVDLNLNWYGNIFSRDGLINAFRNKGGSYNIEAGYSHPLFNQALDLRLKLTGYQFDIGSNVYGWRTGAELTTRDAVFSVKYEHGQDRVNASYDTIGAFVNVGLQLENILRGESPFVMPEPIFQSPRNLRRMLTQKVKRAWYQPTAVVVTRQGQEGGGSLDRFLASVTMVGPADYSSVPLVVPFPAVPHTSLDPTKHIVVEFDYAFDVAPTLGNASWRVDVNSLGAVNTFGPGVVPTVQTGHLSFTLNTTGAPASDQSAFTVTATDPSGLRLQALTLGTSTLTITNVVIHFNQ